MDTAVARSPVRSFIHQDVTWVVREADASGVPGSKGSTALIFDSICATRRIWVFPRNWHQLNASELCALSERSAMISTKLDHKSDDLSSALYASLVAFSRARDLLARAKTAMEENSAQREERRRLLGACRAERKRMREVVESHANDARTAGLTAQDASLYVASAVRETVVRLATTNDSAQRLESDTIRWCAKAYIAA